MYEEEDIILPDDYEEVDTNETLNEEGETTESEGLDTNETTQEVDGGVAKSSNNDDTIQNLLDALKGKVKHNHEEVNFDNLDDVVANLQKGLDYDRKIEKLSSYENGEALKYLNEKRQELGYKSVDEYIASVRKYEEEMKKQREQDELQKMVANGVDEETAKRVLKTESYVDKLKRREAELDAREEEARKKEAQENEFKEFVEMYPNVKAEEIPKEVFEMAKEKNTSLLTSYIYYENKVLKEQKGKLEQSQNNAKSSVVAGVADNGATKQEGDMFLAGFDEEW